VPLELSHWIWPTGETVVGISGEQDMTTVEMVVRYISQESARDGNGDKQDSPAQWCGATTSRKRVLRRCCL